MGIIKPKLYMKEYFERAQRILPKADFLIDKKLVFFGDSITYDPEGFVYLLNLYLNNVIGETRIVNSGFYGDTVVDAAQRLSKDVLANKPDWVFLSFGVNDSKVIRITGLTPVSLGVFELTYKKLIAEIQKGSVEKIILLTPTPIVESIANTFKDWKGDVVWRLEVSSEYAECVRRIASTENLSCVDIHQAFLNHSEFEKLFWLDGVHMSESGAETIALNILLALAKFQLNNS